ncbi:MAG: single-stranded-DNA-specific exonuclease RecJ [Hyphomicrobiales bacterium]
MTSEGPAELLGVARSASGRAWRTRLGSNRDALAIAERHELPEILGRVLAGRQVKLDDVEAFLNPTLRTSMPQPSALRDMEAGAERLAQAIMRGEKIAIISDYDVDGVASAALLTRFLRAVGSDAETHIPDRISEGYGPSEAAVRDLHARGASLLLTLDCGVLAHDPLAKAAELGLDVVVVDHHQPGENLPAAHAVINPNRMDDVSGVGYLCAAGVTMILVASTNRRLRQLGWYREGRAEPNLLQWLELVALATVCDVVPLVGLNRAYVVQGLKIMARRENVGLAALADVSRLTRRPDPYALGFVLGPRLNAAGRVGQASLALRLLVATDRGEASTIALELERLNKQRQAIEMRVVDEAAVQAETALGREKRGPVILVAGENWHPGVLGLVAARLKERFQLPSFALGYARGASLASGSGRSVAGIDLGAAVRAALDAGLLVKGGGHAMAAGLTIARERIGELRDFLEQRFANASDLLARHWLEIDAVVSASGATLELIEMLEQAGPFGAANPAPLFALPAHRIVYADAAGTDHIRCTIAAADGTQLKAIAFRALGTDLGELLLSERQHPLHLVGRLVIDEWNGGRRPALHIEDASSIP